MISKYTLRPGVIVSAVQYDGHNDHAVRSLLPAGASIEEFYRETAIVLRVPDRTARLIHEGDWLSIDADNALTVHSQESFARWWEPVESKAHT